jgi:TetR/AcrR family transcriptional regulator
MAKNKMGLKTKAIILQAAQTIFRRDGFDDCRVDDIAAEAGVTKAMIYYHFESKEDMMMKLIEQMVQTIQEALPQPGSNYPGQMDEHLHHMIQLWEENQEVTSFLVSRAFKDPAMFRTLQKIATPFYNSLLSQKTDVAGSQNRHLSIFFFNTLPMIFFPILREQFAAQYNLSKKEVEQLFVTQFQQVLEQATK